MHCPLNIKERQPHPPFPPIHAEHPGCMVTGSLTTCQNRSSLNIRSLNTSESEPFETQIGWCHCLRAQIPPVASHHTPNETQRFHYDLWGPAWASSPHRLFDSICYSSPVSPSTPATLSFLITYRATAISGPYTCYSWRHPVLPSTFVFRYHLFRETSVSFNWKIALLITSVLLLSFVFLIIFQLPNIIFLLPLECGTHGTELVFCSLCISNAWNILGA